MYHLAHPDRPDRTLCGLSNSLLDPTTTLDPLPITNCPTCLDLYYNDIDEGMTIDAKATRYAHPEGIKTTAADVLGNALLHRTIAKGSKPSKVIDYHMRPNSRNGLAIVLADGQTITLYMPTRFEIIPEPVSEQPELMAEAIGHQWQDWEVATLCLLCLIIGACLTALIW